MNGSAVLRMVWKEYRVMRGFWLSLAGLAVLGQLCCLSYMSTDLSDLLPAIFGVALMATALYALGSGATMFATEREEETFDLLRALPVTDVQVLVGKLSFSLISIFAFGAVVWTSAWVLAGRYVPDMNEQRLLWSTFGLGVAEFLLWSTFFSLLSRRPLVAALLGVAATSATVSGMIAAAGDFRQLHTLAPYAKVVSIRLAVVAVLAVVDLGLALRWLRPMEEVSRRRALPFARWFHGRREEVSEPVVLVQRDRLGWLAWHTWRQSWRMWACIAAAVLVIGGLVLDPTSAFYALIVLVAGASLIGSTAMLSDQERHQFRFFAQHGIRGRYVWLSRQIVAFAVALGLAVVALGLVSIFCFNSFRLPPGSGFPRAVTWSRFLTFGSAVMGAVLLAYTSGQFFSVFVRNGLLAGFFGLLLTTIVCGWAALMITVRFNPVWSVLPIPLSLLLATWVRAPDWLVERNTWRGWLCVGLSVAVPVVGLGTAAALTRVHEIPRVEVGFDAAQFARPRTPAERETASIYREAAALLKRYKGKPRDQIAPFNSSYADQPLTAPERQWLEENAKPLAMAREASARAACVLEPPGTRDFHLNLSGKVHALALLVVTQGRQQEQQGKLAAALSEYLSAFRIANHMRSKGYCRNQNGADETEQLVYARLVRWAARAGQTSELVRDALQRVEQLQAECPPRSDAVKSAYVFTRRLCDRDWDAVENAGLGQHHVRQLMLMSWGMPWESCRARRLLDYAAKLTLSSLEIANRRLAAGRQALVWTDPLPWHLATPADQDSQLEFWIGTTPAVAQGFTPYSYRSSVWWELVQLEAKRRVARILLALRLWRLEHGSLPESLSQLEGTTIDPLPVDPYTGKPFCYYPHGISEPAYARWFSRGAVAPGTPLIWSPGWLLYDYDYERDDNRHWATRYGWTALSDEEAISRGFSFPILSSK